MNYKSHDGKVFISNIGPITSFTGPEGFRLCVDGTEARFEKYPSESWNGEGVPPVGLTVEAYFPTDTKPAWLPTKLLYISDSNVVYGDGYGHREISVSRKAFEALGASFRPLLTAEQIAAEELQSIRSWLIEQHSNGGLDGITKALHADGYRKQVTE